MNMYFNTQHAPLGAHASFTLGFPGAKGGMDLERCGSPNQDTLIGLESPTEAGVFEVLPFMDAPTTSEADRFVSHESGQEQHALPLTAFLRAIPKENVTRSFGIATDSWQAGDLTYTLYSPSGALPDPALGDTLELQRAIVPAIFAEVRVDNRQHTQDRRLALGFNRCDPYAGLCHIADGAGLIGFGQGRHLAIVTEHPGAWSALGLSWGDALTHQGFNRGTGLGSQGVVAVTIPAGQDITLRFAYCFYRGDYATAGLDTRYYYTRFFKNIEAVGRFALQEFDAAKASALAADAQLDASKLSADQRFIVAHATRSYYYSTQLLELDGAPLWVVNEGEYNMLNTLDLVSDHSLYEMRQHPWTIRNVLDQFVARYSFIDQIKGPEGLVPGGISFVHDMGACAVFAAPGRSAYERAELRGCFSQMTMEELLNWVLTTGLYLEASGDLAWLQTRQDTLLQCLDSLERRDHPNPAERIGALRWDSDRTGTGKEITTYDCLDPSLGQASGNTYLAGKLFAASVVLDRLFEKLGNPQAKTRAWQQAERAAHTVANAAGPDGLIPALLGSELRSVILPVVEGLAYAYFAGAHTALDLNGPFAPYFAALRRHMLEHVLKEAGCLYPDGGWRITSANANTFPAKVYVCQFAARHILKLPIEAISQRADAAHLAWLTHPVHSVWCWSEQVVDGEIYAAKYYPRGVNSQVWLSE